MVSFFCSYIKDGPEQVCPNDANDLVHELNCSRFFTFFDIRIIFTNVCIVFSFIFCDVTLFECCL